MNVTRRRPGDGTQTWTVTAGSTVRRCRARRGYPGLRRADVELGILLRGLSVADQDRTTLEELSVRCRPTSSLDEPRRTLVGDRQRHRRHARRPAPRVARSTDLPWEQLDIGSVNLQTYASPPTLITFTGTLV